MTAPAIGRVLIADDQMHVLNALEMLLTGNGWATKAVMHAAGVMQALEAEQFDAVLIDLNYARDTTSGGEGLELLSRIRSMDSLVPVIVMTAWSSVDLAVEAMQRGASDFIQKPWENQDLLQKLQHQVSMTRLRRQAQWRRNQELQEAREIQDSLLRRTLPEIAGYEVAAATQSLRFVGGDYYSVVRLNDREIAFCIADVAGKGLPAALLMSSLQAALKPLVWQGLAPHELCHRLNRIMCDLTPLGKFISLVYAVLDEGNHRLTYCNAGHNPPLLIRGTDDTFIELKTSGAVLGQFPRWLYDQNELQMRSGDKLLLFTDGLVEACNVREEPFGEHNVIRIVRENPSLAAEELARILMCAASHHSGGHFQDDVSLIVLMSL